MIIMTSSRFLQSSLALLLLQLLLPSGCHAQTPTSAPVSEALPTESDSGWGGCVDPTTGASLVTIGQKTTVCFIIANGVDWQTTINYMRLNFQPVADDYSRFHVPRSYQNLVLDTDTDSSRVAEIFLGKNITVHVASQQALSFQRRYYDGFGKVYPYLTAIIDVRDGVVQGIAWDNACIFCNSWQCEDNTFDFNGKLGTSSEFGQPVRGCYVEDTECTNSANAGGTLCDLLLYVVWTGTDSNGLSFQSSAYRFSSFPPQELANRLTQNLPDLPELPDFPNVPFTGEDNTEGNN